MLRRIVTSLVFKYSKNLCSLIGKYLLHQSCFQYVNRIESVVCALKQIIFKVVLYNYKNRNWKYCTNPKQTDDQPCAKFYFQLFINFVITKIPDFKLILLNIYPIYIPDRIYYFRYFGRKYAIGSYNLKNRSLLRKIVFPRLGWLYSCKQWQIRIPFKSLQKNWCGWRCLYQNYAIQ